MVNFDKKTTMDFEKIDLYYKKVSYLRKHDHLTLEEWQFALRKQFASTHSFRVKKLGNGSVYSDYLVSNPETTNAYKVALRSADNSLNFCECGDFKTNLLGTCKHIEAVFVHIENQHKTHLLDRFRTIPYTSVFLDYRNHRKVSLRIGSENKIEFQKLASDYFNPDFCLKETVIDSFDIFLAKAQEISDTFRCYPDALELVLEKRETSKRSQLVAKYRKDTTNPFSGFSHVKLFPYQEEGVYFAAEKGRCVIADDMGLGKTLEAIVAAELLHHEIGISSVFIICPTSLKYQWKTEIEKFTGKVAWVVEGLVTKRKEQYINNSFYKIVSYHTAVNDMEHINAAGPDLVILDEAQRIKNFKTRIAQTIKKLKSAYAFVLTGTPLENKLEELYSIVQFIDPFALGPYFKYLDDHRICDTHGKIIGYKDLHLIAEQLQNVMIRRRKQDVSIQLPKRMDKVLFVPMTKVQAEMHDDFQFQVSLLVNRWRRQGFLNEKDRQRLMIYMNSMRMVCDSSYILDQQTRHDTKIGELMNILDEVFAEGNEKVVVFSQWERMTRLVAKELDERNIGYEYLHGGIPGSDRGKLYKNFDNDPQSRVFLSTDAGGVGLNLQVASLLINLDIPWNPAVLEQRIARIYRMGQKKNVSIINMVATGTIEHRMLSVVDFKKGLAEGILDHGESTIFMPDSQFKVFMNTVEKMVDSQSTELSKPDSNTVEEQESETREAIISGGETELEPLTPQHDQIPTYEQDAAQKSDEPSFAGDDDVVISKTTLPEEIKTDASQPEQLVQMGISFLSQLGEALSNPESTKKLVNSLVRKDETDGKTYLKIPVENEKMVENALSLIAGLFNSFKK